MIVRKLSELIIQAIKSIKILHTLLFYGITLINIHKLHIPIYRNQFRALQVPPHLWGMVSHNFVEISIPAENVALYGRPDLNQDSLASNAIDTFLTSYNEKLNKEYFKIDVNQDGRMHIFALPDTNVEWNALSTICIW